MSDTFRARVRTRLTGLLPRLRHSLPLPVEPKEVYRAAFPESKLCDWLYDPQPTDMRNPALPYRNVVACTNRETVVQFCMMSQAEFDELTDESDQARFWIRFPRAVTAPPHGASFMLSDAMRCHRPLVDWYNAACNMEGLIQHFTMKVYQLSERFANPSELALAWPEVVTAVPGITPPSAKLRIAARSPRIKEVRAEVLRDFPLGEGGEMDRFTSLLATAIMLPPACLPDAWVGLYDTGLEEWP